MHFHRRPTITNMSPSETTIGPAKRGPDYPIGSMRAVLQ
jgi:hypothetical protein